MLCVFHTPPIGFQKTLYLWYAWFRILLYLYFMWEFCLLCWESLTLFLTHLIDITFSLFKTFCNYKEYVEFNSLAEKKGIMWRLSLENVITSFTPKFRCSVKRLYNVVQCIVTITKVSDKLNIFPPESWCLKLIFLQTVANLTVKLDVPIMSTCRNKLILQIVALFLTKCFYFLFLSFLSLSTESLAIL